MTITPSGWYPDPGQHGAGPVLERWWDGTTWTEYTRTAPQPTQQPDIASAGAQTVRPTPSRRRSTVIVTAIGVTLLVVGGVIAGIGVLNGDEGKNAAHTKPSPSAGGRDGQDPGSSGPQAPGGFVTDANLGVSLPILQGWQQQDTQGDGNAYISTKPYTCTQSSTGTCVSAGVYTGPTDGEDPKAAAEQDIASNAKESYGNITGHRQIKAQSVTVAGQSGYLVRWKVEVSKGIAGYVQTVAFKSPATGLMALIRFGFDDSPQAPNLGVMDDILGGIRITRSSSNSV